MSHPRDETVLLLALGAALTSGTARMRLAQLPQPMLLGPPGLLWQELVAGRKDGVLQATNRMVPVKGFDKALDAILADVERQAARRRTRDTIAVLRELADNPAEKLEVIERLANDLRRLKKGTA